jgi:hypothetical protein
LGRNLRTFPDAAAEIKAVLDCTALESYARGHVHIGELLKEIGDEEESVVAIPSVALLDAHSRAAGNPEAKALLNYVVTLPSAVVLVLDRATAPRVAQHVSVMKGDLSRAHVTWAVMTHKALCFTTEPEAYPPRFMADKVVAVPTEDA